MYLRERLSVKELVSEWVTGRDWVRKIQRETEYCSWEVEWFWDAEKIEWGTICEREILNLQISLKKSEPQSQRTNKLEI